MNMKDSTLTIHLSHEEKYNKGDVIFEEGTSGDWVYFVLEGEVEIFKTIGGKRIILDALKKGAPLGEVSFIDKKPRELSARAATDVTLGIFDTEYLTAEYNKLPGHLRSIIETAARRLRKMIIVASSLAGQKSQGA